jgi:hypothetical protein
MSAHSVSGRKLAPIPKGPFVPKSPEDNSADFELCQKIRKARDNSNIITSVITEATNRINDPAFRQSPQDYLKNWEVSVRPQFSILGSSKEILARIEGQIAERKLGTSRTDRLRVPSFSPEPGAYQLIVMNPEHFVEGVFDYAAVQHSINLLSQKAATKRAFADKLEEIRLTREYKEHPHAFMKGLVESISHKEEISDVERKILRFFKVTTDETVDRRIMKKDQRQY